MLASKGNYSKPLTSRSATNSPRALWTYEFNSDRFIEGESFTSTERAMSSANCDKYCAEIVVSWLDLPPDARSSFPLLVDVGTLLYSGRSFHPWSNLSDHDMVYGGTGLKNYASSRWLLQGVLFAKRYLARSARIIVRGGGYCPH